MAKRSLADRFHEKYIVDENTGCWLWSGCITRNGYGQLRMNGKPKSAHRVSWFLHNQEMPPAGLDVCHKCDVRHCVNPACLFIGTRQDNMQDAKRKGRTRSGNLKGENHGQAKLTQKEVDVIRGVLERHPPTNKRLGFTFGIQSFLSKWFDVSVTQVRRIRTRKNYV